MRAPTDILVLWVLCAGLVGELVAGAVACVSGVESESEPGFWPGVMGVAGSLWVFGIAERALPNWPRRDVGGAADAHFSQ